MISVCAHGGYDFLCNIVSHYNNEPVRNSTWSHLFSFTETADTNTSQNETNEIVSATVDYLPDFPQETKNVNFVKGLWDSW